MKILAQLALAGLLATATASVSKAIVWTDYQSGSPLAKITTSNSYKGEFNLNANGYDASTMQVSSARVWFAFADDALFGDIPVLGDGGEWVEIFIDSTSLIGPVEVDGSHFFGFDWVSGDITGSLLGSLSATGKLAYEVTVTRGDTYLKVAKLRAWGDYKQVPDAGATITFIGLGLMGLAAARKRFC